MGVKTSFVLPRELYKLLKRRAAEERRSMRDIVMEALLQYFSSSGKGEGGVLEFVLSPVEGAGPEDYEE